MSKNPLSDNYNTTLENVYDDQNISKNNVVKNKIVDRCNKNLKDDRLAQNYISNRYNFDLNKNIGESKSKKLTIIAESFCAFLLSEKTKRHDLDKNILSVSSEFMKQFSLLRGLKLNNQERSWLINLFCKKVQDSCYVNSKKENLSSWSNGYIVNTNEVNHFLSLVKGNKIPREYNLLKDAIRNKSTIYSFNSSFDFSIRWGNNNKTVDVKSTGINLDNIDNMNGGDLIVNFWEKFKNIPKIINRLQSLKSQYEKRNVKGSLKNSTLEKKKSQIDLAITMLDFMEETGHWVDVYHVAGNGRFYSMGLNFQTTPKYIKQIILSVEKDLEEVDQKSAQIQICCDLAPESEEKQFVQYFLQETQDIYDRIKLESGHGKKWFKTRRSSALYGKIFDDVKNSPTALKICQSILFISSQVSKEEIIKEERKRTLELASNKEIIVWLHDGAIVR